MGYADPSCYGDLYGHRLVETPNIDRLALAKSMKKELMKILNSANARFPERK